MNPLNMRVASNIFMQKTNDHHLKSQYMHYKNGTSLPPTFTTTTLCLLVIDPSFFVLFVKGFLSLISLSLSQTIKKKQREKREKTEREMAVSRASLGGVTIIAIFFAVILQVAQAQSPSPAPTPTSDGIHVFFFFFSIVFCLFPRKNFHMALSSFGAFNSWS